MASNPAKTPAHPEVEHYQANSFFNCFGVIGRRLTEEERFDLIEYLKTL
jgi:hypothetical protein